MKRLAYSKQRDLNEPGIVAGLRDAGVLVYLLDDPCDLLCQVGGKWTLMEVKNPEGSGRRLTAKQREFWEVANPPPIVVENLVQALVALGLVGSTE